MIVEGEGAVLGVNLGRPVVTNGDFATSGCPHTLSTGVPIGRLLTFDILEHDSITLTLGWAGPLICKLVS